MSSPAKKGSPGAKKASGSKKKEEAKPVGQDIRKFFGFSKPAGAGLPGMGRGGQ
jgi:hypothetical protein